MNRLLRINTLRWLVAGLLLALLLPALPVVPVRAGTLTVANTADSGAGSLRQAITDAVAGDTIQFTPGLSGTITLTTGTLTIDKNLTIDGMGATITVDGGCTWNGTFCSSGGVTVFTVNSGVTAAISGLTIQHGNTGGIHNEGTLTVTNSTLTDNHTTSNGGGIHNDGTLTVTNSTLSGNTATGSGDYGGGIYNGLGGTVTVTNSTLSGNIAAPHGGGGIANSGTVTVTNSTFTANRAGFGGGGGILNSGTLTVTNSTLSGNTSQTGGGGIANSGTVTVTNSTLSGNPATVTGGGIENRSGGTMTVTNSTLSGNRTGWSASFSGQGGGIYNGGSTATLTNTIVAANTASPGPDIYGAVTTSSHNLIGSLSGSSGITNGVNGDIVNPTPLLGALGDYGGPTQTVPLLPGSPAIDAGDDATCAAALPNGAGGKDQRGVTRPQGAHCDIGAFESQGFSLTKTSGDNQSTPIGAPFANPLVVTLASTHSEPVDGGSVTFTVLTDAGAQATFGTLAGCTLANGNLTARCPISGGTASSPPLTPNTAGPFTVTAAATGSTPPAVSFTLTNGPPTISAISPPTGPTTGGAPVAVTGTGFAAGATVTLGGVACTNLVLVSPITLFCTTGAHDAGAVDVVVTVGSETGTLAGGYTYAEGTPLPAPQPSGPGAPSGPPSPLPGRQPAGTTGGAPNPLPAPRP